MVVLTPRPVCSSLEELLDGATSRAPFLDTDGKSGAPFERVVIGGEPFILKHVHVDRDWTMRFNGDVGCMPAVVWRSGLMDVLPERIDHAVVAVATGLGRNQWGAALLMRDVSDAIVPAGDDMVSGECHEQFLGDMAALAARMWGWTDEVGLIPMGTRWTWFGHASLEVEAEQGWPVPVPRIAFDAWQRFAARAPGELAEAIDALRRDPSPLVEALRTTPLTFVHGDFKLGNLGMAADGRTVLIDWTLPGEGPCTYELTWYLAVNHARMPQSKGEAVDIFRRALEANGIDTLGWFDKQLALAMLGGLLLFGWEKALGDDEELEWWCERAREGVAQL